ncbi:hypothetical protein [Spirillospora sp. CA-294931]|uniref:hypothetical protein n=1 Tax=Spirillospora sp. CA-294931 TaxID=3240042 RepID=UPI003D918B1A
MNARRTTMYTDLMFGIVPRPSVLVAAVAAMIQEGTLAAGRIGMSTPELLAEYAGGERLVDVEVAARSFALTWRREDLVGDIAQLLSCTEVDDLAELLAAAGHGAVAEACWRSTPRAT